MKQSLETMQERDLKNIAERGFSNNLYEKPIYQYNKDGEWRDLSPSQSPFKLALDGYDVRKKKVS